MDTQTIMAFGFLLVVITVWFIGRKIERLTEALQGGSARDEAFESIAKSLEALRFAIAPTRREYYYDTYARDGYPGYSLEPNEEDDPERILFSLSGNLTNIESQLALIIERLD